MTSNTVDGVDGNAHEMIGDGNSSLQSRNFVRVGDERAVTRSKRAHLNVFKLGQSNETSPPSFYLTVV